jgi:carboxypeptidase A4
MTPFGSDCNERPKDEENLEELALGATKALKAVHGTSFAAGSVCKIIYQVSQANLISIG